MKCVLGWMTGFKFKLEFEKLAFLTILPQRTLRTLMSCV